MEKLLLRVDEAAEMLAMGRSQIYEMLKAGELPMVRVGNKSMRIPKVALEAWVKEQTRTWQSMHGRDGLERDEDGDL